MTAGTQETPRDWVPVEHRWFGLDRRTFPAGLTSLAIALVLIYGLPALNAAIPWHNQIKAGQVLELGDGATAVPPVGWQLESGSLTGGNATSLQVKLASGGATIELTGTSYDGTATAFLDQVDRSESDAPGVSGRRGTLTTGGGLVGVVESRTSTGGDGIDAAFKMATGTPEAVEAAPALLVRVRTAPGQFEQYQDEVAALLRSITPGPAR
ncbi:hypothetical protein ACIBG5_15965 [Kribbella sp. NPDC050241]|uniref:hypothetical protein n=1 Tax=Kribbella sp. NPDC050241 TaxID=3364115 RepID=UPI003791FEA2